MFVFFSLDINVLGLFDFASAVVVLLEQFEKNPSIPEESEGETESFSQCYFEPLVSELNQIVLSNFTGDFAVA